MYVYLTLAFRRDFMEELTVAGVIAIGPVTIQLLTQLNLN